MSNLENPNELFDIFISYNWESKDKVKILYRKLSNEYNLKVWIDDNQLDNNLLYDQLVNGIKNSKIFLCCITKKYSESFNCIREINYASELRKPFIVLMFEELSINEIGCVGFIITPLLRFNCFMDKTMLYNWSGPIFESMLKSLNNYLNFDSNLNTPCSPLSLYSKTTDRSLTNHSMMSSSIELKDLKSSSTNFSFIKSPSVYPGGLIGERMRIKEKIIQFIKKYKFILIPVLAFFLVLAITLILLGTIGNYLSFIMFYMFFIPNIKKIEI